MPDLSPQPIRVVHPAFPHYLNSPQQVKVHLVHHDYSDSKN